MDVGCPIARTTYALAKLADGKTDEAIAALREGLTHAPGQPAMVRMVIETLVEIDNLDEADELLKAQRPLLGEFGTPGLAERLGELVALAKLERSGEREVDLSNPAFAWLEELDASSKSWLASAVFIRQENLRLAEAYMLYLAKVAERELFVRLFEPFKKSLPQASELYTNKLEDLSRYIVEGRKPGLGGMTKGLTFANRSFRSDEPQLVTELRNFLKDLPQAAMSQLRSKVFLDRLWALGLERNAIAHTGEPDPSKLDDLSSFVLDGDSPGELLEALIPISRT